MGDRSRESLVVESATEAEEPGDNRAIDDGAPTTAEETAETSSGKQATGDGAQTPTVETSDSKQATGDGAQTTTVEMSDGKQMTGDGAMTTGTDAATGGGARTTTVETPDGKQMTGDGATTTGADAPAKKADSDKSADDGMMAMRAPAKEIDSDKSADDGMEQTEIRVAQLAAETRQCEE